MRCGQMAFASAPESREIRYFRYEFCRSIVECNVVRCFVSSNDVARAVDAVASGWFGLLARLLRSEQCPPIGCVGVVTRRLRACVLRQ